MTKHHDLTDVELFVKIDREDKDAVGFSVTYRADRLIWLPRSLIEYEITENRRNLATVTLPEWLAIREGLV